VARVIICGTLAYDDIGHFDGPLTAHTRNVKLTRLERGFGGCAMNVAYNLRHLGHEPVPFVYAGDDYSGEYAGHVARAGISEAGIFRIPGTPSARGIVLTGSDGAQFTAFYPGPSGHDRWQRDLGELLACADFDGAVLAPDLPEKMSGCAAEMDGIGLRIWCPGQYAELLDGGDINAPLDWCNLLVVNRHEWHSLARHVPEAELECRAGRVVITDGAGAVTLLPDHQSIAVARVAGGAQDPTGCGDAFVAALTATLLEGHGLTSAVRAGIALAARCLACHGAQSHRPDDLAAAPSRRG
jgi:adenosine kinase